MSPEHQSKLEFFNSYGLVFEDRFYLHRYNYSSFIDIDNLNKIKLVKKRKLSMNFFFFITGFGFLIFGLLYCKNVLIVKGFSSLFSFLFILLSFIYRKYNYSILMVTNTLQPLEIKVDNDFKSDAEEIISQINKKIELKKTNLAVAS
jgi:hypothetical protein